MAQVRFRTLIGLFLVLSLSAVLAATVGALAGPPAGPEFRLGTLRQMILEDISVLSQAVVDENTVVLVGTTANPDDMKDHRTLPPNGTIVDLAKKTSRVFTNGHTAEINNVAASRGRIVTASDTQDPVLRVWDVTAAKTIAAIAIEKPKSIDTGWYSVACFHGSNRLAVSTLKKVIVLDPDRPNVRAEYPCPDDQGLSGRVVVSPDDAVLVGQALYGQELVTWDMVTRKPKVVSLLPKGADPRATDVGIRPGSFGPKGRLFITRDYEIPEGTAEADVPTDRRGVAAVDLPAGHVTPLRMGHTLDTHSCAVDPSGTWLATAGAAWLPKPPPNSPLCIGEMRVYHLPTGKLVLTERFKEATTAGWVAFSPSGKRLICRTVDNVLRWWDVATK